MSSALTQIEKLELEIAALRKQALQELRAKRESLAEELAKIDAQIASLSGTPASTEKKQPRVVGEKPGKSVPLTELKALLAEAPEKTLNIRNAGLQLANIKTLAQANPHLLKMGGKGAWPTVTLLS